MRLTALLSYILVLLMLSCFFAGCSTEAPAASSQKTLQGTNAGFSPVNRSADTGEFRFAMTDVSMNAVAFPSGRDTARADELYPPGTIEQPRDVHLIYVSGNNLDESGNATRWTYAVRSMNKTFLVTRDRNGETVIEWTAALPEDEIFFDSIQTPAQLFAANGAAIFPTPDAKISGTRDLALGKGIYSLTISGAGKTRVLLFDAKTGALL